MLEEFLKTSGKIFIDCSEYKYIGETNEDGQQHGKGEKLYSSGNLFKGNFERGKLHGECSVETESGAVF